MADEKGKTVHVTSYNQSGGITAGIVNLGPQQRSLSDARSNALKAQILSELSRTKPITVICLLSDAEAYRFAAEIHTFLKSNGFQLTEDGISQGVFTPPPRGLSVDDRGDHLDFVVGSAN